MSFVQEFKEFALRGNVVDLAIGVIIGGAFGKIIASLVADVIMPPLGILLGKMDFKSLAYVLKPATVSATGEAIPAVTLNYGLFLQNVFDFLLVALCIFVLIKFFIRARKEEQAAPPAPSDETVLLSEIRDLLKQR